MPCTSRCETPECRGMRRRSRLRRSYALSPAAQERGTENDRREKFARLPPARSRGGDSDNACTACEVIHRAGVTMRPNMRKSLQWRTAPDSMRSDGYPATTSSHTRHHDGRPAVRCYWVS